MRIWSNGDLFQTFPKFSVLPLAPSVIVLPPPFSASVLVNGVAAGSVAGSVTAHDGFVLLTRDQAVALSAPPVGDSIWIALIWKSCAVGLVSESAPVVRSRDAVTATGVLALT